MKVITAGIVGIATIIIFKINFSDDEKPLAKGTSNLRPARSGYKKLIISYS
ncbi:MAG: hypothetical protein ACR2NW_01210 [Thermodesulfobacteriota bacterium]